MRAIFDIARNELRILFSDRGIWINIVLIPIVIAIGTGFANGAGSSGPSDGPRLVVDVLDNDDSPLSQQFLADVRAANTRLVLCPMDNDDTNVCGLEGASLTPDVAQQRLEAENALAQIEIPAGFGSSAAAGETTTIIYRSNEDVTAPSYILQAVQAATQRLGGVQSAVTVANDVTSDLSILEFEDEADRAAFEQQVREQAQALWTANPVTINYVQASVDPSAQSSGGEGFQQSIPGIGSMYVMFTVLPAAAAFLLERKQWTMQRLATMPISRAQILGGKLLARFLMGMIQFGVLFGFGLLLGLRYGSDPIALILLMVVFSLCVTAMALALTTVLRNVEQASVVALFLSLTLAPLGGAWWPLDIVPEWMRIVGHISPIAWVMDGFRSLIFYGGSLETVVVPILALLAMMAAFFTFGVLRFRYD